MADTNTNPNPVAAASNDALQAVYEHAGRMVGELSAHEAMTNMLSNPMALGKVVQGMTPGIPAPQAAIPVPAGSPVVPAGLAGRDREEAITLDRANVINTLQGAVQKFGQYRQAKEQQVAVRDYQLLMTAMQALQQDPQNQHNIKLVNDFFSDPSRVKRMQKVLGMEGISAFDHKAQAKRASDPDAQAFDKAIALAQQGQILPGGAMEEQPGGAAIEKTQPQTSDSQAQGPLSQLGPEAQKFFGQFPEVPYQQAVLSPQGMLMKMLVDNKLAPDANTQATTEATRYGHKVDLIKNMMTQLNQRDITDITQRTEVYKKVMDVNSAASIAWLEHLDRRAGLEVEKWKASLTKDANDIALSQLIGNRIKDRIEFAQQKLTTLMTIATQGMKNLDGEKLKTTNEEIRKAKDEVDAQVAALDQWQKEHTDRIGAHGVSTRAGRSAADNVADAEREVGLGGSAKSSGGASNSGNGKPSSNGSSVSADVSAERGGVVPSGGFFDNAGSVVGNILKIPTNIKQQIKGTE